MAEKLTLAVLGAGNIGGTLGRKWSAAGHRVLFGVNDPQGQRAQALRKEFGEDVVIGRTADVLAADPDVVVMAVPGKAMDEIIAENASLLDGKVIIDTANRVGESVMNSFATFQKHTPRARTFRAFNTLGWENFADPHYDGVQADLFYCGPDGEARSMVEGLIADIGLRPIYVGGVEQVGLVDSLAALWFALAFGQGRGRHLAFKALTR